MKKRKFFHTTFSCNLYQISFSHLLKQLVQLRREIFKSFFLLPIRRFRIYVHRSLDVLVPHDGLDHSEIALHLAEPGRKGMPEMMAGKFRKQHWLATFPCSIETLIGVICDFRHNTIRRILPDNVVPDCHLKSWMQERVNVVHRGDGKLLVIDEMKVILQDIRILDIDELFLSEIIPHEAIIHVDIIAPSAVAEIWLHLDVPVKGIVNRRFSGGVQIQSIQLISRQLFFSLPQFHEIGSIDVFSSRKAIGLK